MKKDDLRKLILKLAGNAINGDLLEDILKNEEVLSNELINIDNSKLKYAIDIVLCNYYDNVEDKLRSLKTYKELEQYKEYIAPFFTNEYMIKAGIIDEAVKIINESKEAYNAEYASYVLRDEDAIEAGIALEGAKIINESKEAYNASCASHVLRDENAIEAGIALEGAKIINESKEAYNASCASYVLKNENAIEAGIALEGAKIVNESKNEYMARHASQILQDKDAIEAGVALVGSKLINESKSRDHLVSYLKSIKGNIYEDFLIELEDENYQGDVNVKEFVRKIGRKEK